MAQRSFPDDGVTSEWHEVEELDSPLTDAAFHLPKQKKAVGADLPQLAPSEPCSAAFPAGLCRCASCRRFADVPNELQRRSGEKETAFLESGPERYSMRACKKRSG